MREKAIINGLGLDGITYVALEDAGNRSEVEDGNIEFWFSLLEESYTAKVVAGEKFGLDVAIVSLLDRVCSS